VGSSAALRVYALSKQMGEPLPQFSDDDVVDFMVKEAVMAHGLAHEAEQEKKRQKEEWKRRPVGSGTPGSTM
jgi:hypothetical protein